VKHTRYDLSSFITKSSESKDFSVDDGLVPGLCIIVDLPCEYDGSSKIHVSYDLARGTAYYVCLGIVIVFSVGTIGLIAGCIYCCFRKSKGTQGTTYQPVGEYSSQTTPAVYQQPQAPAAYQQPIAYQQQPAAYQQPAYTTPAPTAPPAFNPAYAPGYDPSYGTAPAPGY